MRSFSNINTDPTSSININITTNVLLPSAGQTENNTHQPAFTTEQAYYPPAYSQNADYNNTTFSPGMTPSDSKAQTAPAVFMDSNDPAYLRFINNLLHESHDQLRANVNNLILRERQLHLYYQEREKEIERQYEARKNQQQAENQVLVNTLSNQIEELNSKVKESAEALAKTENQLANQTHSQQLLVSHNQILLEENRELSKETRFYQEQYALVTVTPHAPLHSGLKFFAPSPIHRPLTADDLRLKRSELEFPINKIN